MPGTRGAPTFWAMCRARTLSPNASMAAGGGPIQISPAASTASAKDAFSARKPYPGWMASAPLRAAMSRIFGDVEVGLRGTRAAQRVRLIR